MLFLYFFLAKDGLYNDVVTQLNERSDQFPKSMGGETISGYINMLVGALWYISGNMGSIMERACHTPDVVKSIPERYILVVGHY